MDDDRRRKLAEPRPPHRSERARGRARGRKKVQPSQKSSGAQDAPRRLGAGLHSSDRALPAFFRALGMSIVEAGEERVVLRMDVPDAFYTPYGAIHGGILAALADTAGGIVVAMKLTPADRTATHALDVHYLSFVRERSCTCVGRLLSLGTNVATVELEVVKEGGSLAAKALGVYGIFRSKNS